jgi:hypothetical protein
MDVKYTSAKWYGKKNPGKLRMPDIRNTSM